MGDNMDINTLQKQNTNTINLDSILLSDDINKALEIRKNTTLSTKISIKLNPNKLYDINILEKIRNIDNTVKIIYGFEDVNISDFIYVMSSLDNMVNPIINTNLSTLEKYLYIYNLTTHFKTYKEEEYREDDALSLFRVFDKDNDLIVCGGYAKILFELNKRIGINNSLIRVNTYDITEDGYKRSSPHIRNIGRIVDTKYNIDGIYIMDSTWNNNLKQELYTTALLTPYESISTYDTNIGTGSHDFLSSQSYDEFIYQLEKDSKNDYPIFRQTINYLKNMYPEFSNKLNNLDYKEIVKNEDIIKYIFDFIYDKCNKKISGKTIIEALTNVLKTIYSDITQEEIDEYINNVSKANYDNYDNLFLISKEYDDGYYMEYLSNERNNKFK